MQRASVALGALAPERDRAMVVLSGDGELAVGLRERLDRTSVTVKDARAEEAESAMASCLPWPWAVVGAVPELPERAAEMTGLHPTLVLWLGPVPAGLPAHHRRFTRFSELAGAVEQALEQEVAGMRMSPGAGVRLPSGRLCTSGELQALVSAHPHGFALPASCFRSAARALVRADLPLRPLRDRITGLVSLQ